MLRNWKLLHFTKYQQTDIVIYSIVSKAVRKRFQAILSPISNNDVLLFLSEITDHLEAPPTPAA